MNWLIFVQDLPEHQKQQYQGFLNHKDFLRLQEMQIACETLSFEITLRREGFTVFMDGNIIGCLTIQCSRCLEPFQWEIPENLNLVLLPESYQHDLPQELQLSNHDLESAFYSEGKINVLDAIEEQILLELPLRTLCQEECRGLCANCGYNLNERSCSCSFSEISNNPFAVLLDSSKNL